jgi:hypothetical protein
MRRSLLLPILLWCLATVSMYAEGSAFDLTGPEVDIHVKRGDITLPISETPNLLPGDRLWIHPDLPESQSTHFVLVIAFLRGATNPPPPDWFTRVETWNRDVRSEGVFVTVPAEAQQALIFLAPETSGDFNTLRNAVRSMPGSFVRASQDLQEASWERMRLENYLDEVKVTSQTDPKTLKARAEMAARSLGIKINESCFDKPTDQQVSCLSQNSEGLVLDDANAQSVVSQITNGDTLNLVNDLSSTPMGGGGLYSPYIGAIVDTARILSSLHTAHFQYIPALALPKADTLNLRLNMPPSFRNPKSVVVVALPPLGPAHAEPLHPVSPDQDFCVQKPELVLPAEGAPLVFATQLAHNLVLHIESESKEKGLPVDLPVVADPAKGGLVLENPAPELPGGVLTGVVEGKWGFDDWEGPHYLLQASQPGDWSLTGSGESALVVGRDDNLHLEGQSTLCVEKVEAHPKGVSEEKVLWKSPQPNTLEVTVPLKEADPGPVALSIYQYGQKKPETIHLEAYADAASLDLLTLAAGDKDALLKGTRLDEVAKAELEGIDWKPGTLARVQNIDQLTLDTGGSTVKLKPGKRYTASVELLDGRKLKVPVDVEPPRPGATLLSKGVQPDAPGEPGAADQASPVTLGSPNDLPVQDRLIFFLKSTTPPSFSRDEKVEVAATDGSFKTTLDFTNGGGLLLEDASTAMGSLDPLKSFGYSAFGPVEVRMISADGATGDWLPLGTLVRLPGFTELRCPRAFSRPCTLTGTNLFLAASFSSTQDFANPTEVAPDFTGTELTVPHPVDGTLYVKLRDDLATVQMLKLPISWVPERLRTEPRREPVPAPAVEPPPAATPAAPATAPPAGSPSAPPAQPPSGSSNNPATPSPAKPAPSAPTTPSTGTQATPPTTPPAPPASTTTNPANPPVPGKAAPPDSAPAAPSTAKQNPPATKTPATPKA